VSSDPKLGNRLLVIFDGHCVLCNGAVRWFLRHDRRDRLRFAASESMNLAALLARHNIAAANAEAGPNTILVVRDFNGPAEEIRLRSDAALAMLRELPQPWPAVAASLRLIPRPLRDLGYRIVAGLRTRIWGRLESCPIPTAEESKRFLEPSRLAGSATPASP
jgi:predicted DCC family thiol-disulfide oxidoreductase YuxK